MSQFWPSRQSLPAIYMADDELRLAQQQQAQRGLFDGMTLENLGNIPHNIYGLFSNAIADTANAGRAFLDPSVAPDPTRPTAAGDRRLAQRGLDGIGSAALAATPAAMAFRGGGQALGALASNQKPAGVASLFPEYKGSQRVVKTADGGGVAGSISPDGKTLEIGSAWLPEASRGQGTGKAAYQKLIDDARRDGLKVQSDRQVSGSAANVYRSLGAEQNPRAQVSEGGTVTAPRGEPAFLFSDTRQAAPAGLFAASTSKPKEGIKAYHGSPHDFDKFDMSKIGTGEGMNAQGKGLYFSESRKVGEEYRDFFGSDAKLYEVKIDADKGDFLDLDNPLTLQSPQVRAALERANIRSSAERYVVDGERADWSVPEHAAAYLVQIKNQGNLKAAKSDLAEMQGRMNSSSDPREIERLQAISGVLDNLSNVKTLPKLKTAYGEASTVVRGQEEKLRQAGVLGVKYRERGKSGAGSYNYVVFDDKLIEITKKMGIAVPLPPSFPGYEDLSPEERQRMVVVKDADMRKLQRQGHQSPSLGIFGARK